jgi:hypothetical protein
MRRDKAIIGPKILVQVIHVTWDKSGRGGVAAENRNRIPKAFALPKALSAEPGRLLLVHTSRWGHANDFQGEISSAAQILDAADGYQFRCATIRTVAEGAELQWVWNEWGGSPPRQFTDADGNSVSTTHRAIARENEWVRAQWNGRFTCIDTGTWWYEQVTVSVGVCRSLDPPRDLFLRSCPADDYFQMAILR